MPDYLPKKHTATAGLYQRAYNKGLPDPNYTPVTAYQGAIAAPINQYQAQNGSPTNEDLLLAINKIFGTAPAKARQGSLLYPLAGAAPVVMNIPSPEANSRAFELFQQAKIPADLDQATQARMMTEHLQKLGILP
jgi:hypothetical protein